jgi:pimeloyl-ACP methyl ester carboxylesterase
MAHTTSGYMEMSDGGKLYYETAGEGEVVVLGHAAFLDSRMFDAQWELLAKRFRIIRYDMRGFGKSSEVHGPRCRRDDLCQLLRHLSVTRAHFIGCSMGGEIALDLALEQPELAASLCVVCSTPSGFQMQGEPPRYLFEMFDTMQNGDVDRASELAIRIWFDGNYREPDQVDAALRERALTMNRIPVERSTFMIADTQPAKPLDPPAVGRLNEVKCPVLVMVGELDHPEILRAGDLMTANIPDARKAVIDDSAHVPSFEQPDTFNELFLDFVLTEQ